MTDKALQVCQFTNLQWEICQVDVNARAGRLFFSTGVGSDKAKL